MSKRRPQRDGSGGWKFAWRATPAAQRRSAGMLLRTGSSTGGGGAIAPSRKRSTASMPVPRRALTVITGAPTCLAIDAASTLPPRSERSSDMLSTTSVGMPNPRISGTRRNCDCKFVESSTKIAAVGLGVAGLVPRSTSKLMRSSSERG